LEDKQLHIVALNIPYPPNYGGTIDIFYKIKALSELGIKIHLHCFQYGRMEAEELDLLCSSVHYYPRKMHWRHLFSKTPFIVKSRKSKKLLENLKKINAPILYEGLHTCYYLNHSKLKQRPQFVRAHNIESDYYRILAKGEKKLIDKLFLFSEYLKIRAYEKKLNNARGILSISLKDHQHFNNADKSTYIKAFHPDTKITSKEGVGEYAIYHGNLSVAENENAALFLIHKVFSKIDFPLVIAGFKPSKYLRKEVNKHRYIRIVESPEASVLNNIIENAQMQVLHTQQDTGIKLKLLKSLHKGRHCIVNGKMVRDTGLENACHIVEKAKDWISKIKMLEDVPFCSEEIEKRTRLLKEFNCKNEAKKIIRLIYPQE